MAAFMPAFQSSPAVRNDREGRGNGGIIRTKPGPRLDPTRLSGNGKRNVAAWPELPRPSSTLPLTS